MISIKINDVHTIFIKPFTAQDVAAIIQLARGAEKVYEGTVGKILFIDTPITAATVEAVHKLHDEKFRVVFRDHHGVDGDPSNERESRVVAASEKLRTLLGRDCTITVRREHP